MRVRPAELENDGDKMLSSALGVCLCVRFVLDVLGGQVRRRFMRWRVFALGAPSFVCVCGGELQTPTPVGVIKTHACGNARNTVRQTGH